MVVNLMLLNKLMMVRFPELNTAYYHNLYHLLKLFLDDFAIADLNCGKIFLKLKKKRMVNHHSVV